MNLPAKREFLWIAWTVLFACPIPHGYAQGPKKPAEQWQSRGIESALNDPLSSVQLLALQQMLSFSRVDGISPSQITPYLTSGDTDVLFTAASALGRVQANEQIPGLVKLLKNPDTKVRRAAVETLGQMQAKEQVPELVKLLEDPDMDLRFAAAAALEQIQSKAQMPELDKLLNRRDIQVYIALGHVTTQRAMSIAYEEPLAANKRMATWGVNALIRGIRERNAEKHAPELVKLLKNPDSAVRAAAARALGRMRAEERAPELVKLLKDTDDDVRSAAAEALGRMQAKSQIPELVKLLKYPNSGARRAAVEALGQMQTKEETSEILTLLEDPDNDVRRAAVEALSQMQTKEEAPEILKLLEDPDRGVRHAEVEVLGQMQAREEAPELVKLLKDPDKEIRGDAASALMRMGPLPDTIISSIAAIYYSNHSFQGETRFLCYYLTGGDRKVVLLLRRVMYEGGGEPAKPATVAESREEIAAIVDLMTVTRSQEDLARGYGSANSPNRPRLEWNPNSRRQHSFVQISESDGP